MTRPEFWTLGAGGTAAAAALGQRAEAAGWHGLAFVDSQNLSSDVYVALTVAASATERIGLSTAVTNPVTRHPAVTAGAIASVNGVSKGRAVLGIGRGDSSLAHLGRAPASVAALEQYVSVLQSYLHGREVPFSDLGFHERIAPDVATLGLADSPEASRIAWISPDHAKVPVEVAATGPKVIAAAARTADRIMFALGADPERIEWGMRTAREARSKAGLDPEAIEFGAFVNAASHPDRDAARALVSGGLTTFARFQVMHGKVAGPVSAEQREVLGSLHDAYDMKSHTRAASPQAGTLTPEFIDRYAIVGPPEECVKRFQELASLGIGRFTVIGATAGADLEVAVQAGQVFAREVLPAFS